MKLDSYADLVAAQQMGRTVMVCNLDDESLTGPGIITAVDADTVTILEYGVGVGVVHFIRTNVQIYQLDEPVN